MACRWAESRGHRAEGKKGLGISNAGQGMPRPYTVLFEIPPLSVQATPLQIPLTLFCHALHQALGSRLSAKGKVHGAFSVVPYLPHA